MQSINIILATDRLCMVILYSSSSKGGVIYIFKLYNLGAKNICSLVGGTCTTKHGLWTGLDYGLDHGLGNLTAKKMWFQDQILVKHKVYLHIYEKVTVLRLPYIVLQQENHYLHIFHKGQVIKPGMGNEMRNEMTILYQESHKMTTFTYHAISSGQIFAGSLFLDFVHRLIPCVPPSYKKRVGRNSVLRQ